MISLTNPHAPHFKAINRCKDVFSLIKIITWEAQGTLSYLQFVRSIVKRTSFQAGLNFWEVV